MILRFVNWLLEVREGRLVEQVWESTADERAADLNPAQSGLKAGVGFRTGTVLVNGF